MKDDTRVRRVREAALATFLRFGYRKTTMGDIAAAANLSRQALYLLFPNKEAVFRAVLGAMGADALARIRSGLPDIPDRRGRLRHALECWCVAGYALASSSPEAHDLIEGTLEIGRAEMAAVTDRKNKRPFHQKPAQ